MKAITANNSSTPYHEMDETPNRVSHPLWLRICHWLNVIAVFIMITSGWQIYNASPIWPKLPTFPGSITLGGWLAGALMWHFAGMWLLVVNGIFYLFMNLITGRLQRKFFPISIAEFFKDIWLTLKLKLNHGNLEKFNAVQKIAYLFAILDVVVIVASGLVVYKQVQFPILRSLMGGYDNARIVHFFGMAALVGFILVHVTLVLVVPRTLLGCYSVGFIRLGGRNMKLIKSGEKLDKQIILKEADKVLADPLRRLFLKQGISIGALVMLSGCGLSDNKSVETMLKKISGFNDKTQAWLFDPNKLAPEYPSSMITQPFPFNAFYSEDKTPIVDGKTYKLKLSGMIKDKRPLPLDFLNKLPQFNQITRHTCVEGWSAIGQWGGVRFSDFLKLVGADITAKYVGFKCADDYYQSIDMPTALHPQTQLTLTFENETLPSKYGYPMKLRMPTKLGYKNPKLITEIFVTNDYPGGYWEDQGYNWFGGS